MLKNLFGVERIFLFGILVLFTGCATSSEQGTNGDETELVESTPEDLGDPGTSSDRSASEIQADRDARDTFPLVRNEYVDQWINFFTNTKRGRRIFRTWLERKQRYASLIRSTVKEDGLPEDLIYLAMIESGFNPRAHSRAGAAGVWQFMPYTGRNYGLRLDHWYDERRDIVASTHAAAKYLKELHQVFGSWYLAAASYNAGEGRTLRVIRENKTRNYWELIRTKGTYLRETRNYVPKIIAAATISKSPGKYGFTDIEEEQKLVWEEVMIKGGVSLRDVARLIKEPYNELRLLNPELRRGLTPPNKDEWRVRVPPEKRDTLIAKRDSLESHRSGHFITHRLRRGETLSHVSRRYGVRVRTIMDLNNIRSARRVRAGTRLKIPVDYRQAKRSRRSKRNTTVATNGVYRVQGGDTLYDIAKRHNMSTAQLKRANGLRSNTIIPGQKLKVAKVDSGTNTGVYRVKRGDNLNAIADAHGMSLQQLKSLNGLRSNTIYPGQELRVKSSNSAANTKPTSYRVRRGDNLNAIADAHGMSLQELKKLNELRSNVIHPGQKLLVSGRSTTSTKTVWRSYRVRRGDTLWGLAKRHGVSIQALSRKNGLSTRAELQIGQRIKIPE